MAQITFFLLQDLGEPGFPPPSPTPESHPEGGSPAWPHSNLLSCGLHTCSDVPSPKHTLSLSPSASRLLPGAPPHGRPPPSPVYSKPGLLHPPFHPRAPGFRTPLLFSLFCYPGFLRLSPRQSSLAPCPLTTASPHQASPISTSPYLACRAPAPPCRAPPGAGGGRRRDRETGGELSWPCRRDSPASGSAPRPAPGPKPTLPHPPRTERELLRRGAPLGWGYGRGCPGAADPAGQIRRKVKGRRNPAPARPHLGASDPRRPAPPAWLGRAGLGLRDPGGAGRSGAPQRQPGTRTHPRSPCARRSHVRTRRRAGPWLRLRDRGCNETGRPAGGFAFRAEGLRESGAGRPATLPSRGRCSFSRAPLSPPPPRCG
jgi:hypothetical protein